MVSEETKKSIISYLLNDDSIVREALSEALEFDYNELDVEITGLDELIEQIDIDINLNAHFSVKPKTE